MPIKTDINNPRLSLLTLLSFFIIVIGARLHIIDLLASPIPYWDDWGMAGFLQGYHLDELNWQHYFAPANEHRMLFARLLALVFFEANQHQWDPMLMMVVNTFIWALSGFLLVYIANKSSSKINTTALFFLILILFTYPISPVNTLWGIQSHNYLMILFAIIGCWYAGKPALSGKWWFGIFSLFAACFTMAGGSFVSASVAVAYFIFCFLDKENQKSNIITAVAAGCAAIFGITLILIQPSGASELNLLSSITTFMKSLSWPMPREVWPSLIFAAPICILLLQLVSDKQHPSDLTKFTICLYGFVVIVCLGIAVARSSDGSGPTRRYFEFLSLAFIASATALLLIKNFQFKRLTNLKLYLSLFWVLTFTASIPFQIEVLTYTMYDRNQTRPAQSKFTNAYLRTKNIAWLEGKIFRHIPYPHASLFAEILDEANEHDILPYQLQTPLRLLPDPTISIEQRKLSPFINNGIFIASENEIGKKYKHEIPVGSYRPGLGGKQAMGKYRSANIEINRPYVMVPVIGYTGYDGLSLKLVNVHNNKEYEIKPKPHSKYAEVWREHLMKIPRGYYQVVAEDNNPNLWLGFAAPRTVGRYSYYAQQLMDHGDRIWQLGLFLLIISFRRSIFTLFEQRNDN